MCRGHLHYSGSALGGSKGLGVARNPSGVVTVETAARTAEDRENGRDRTRRSRAKKKKAEEKAKEREEREKMEEGKEQ